MTETLYRRPLPSDAIAFSSEQGRRLFGEALAAGGLDGYFPLAEQFHTQADPMFCGLGSLVVALNALGIDPGRLWKGPWRWFAEDLLDCCIALEEVRKRGLDLDEVACLARCNGAEVELQRERSPDELRAALARASRGEAVMIAAYDRGALDQTGTGHFSPIGGFHAARDLALVLDVARFKYPPHWVPAERLWRAMQTIDPANGRARGWLLLRPRPATLSLGYTLRCDGDTLQGLAARLAAVADAAAAATSLDELARRLVPLTGILVAREPSSAAHRAALAATRAAVHGLTAYPRVAAAVDTNHPEVVLVLMLALADGLERTASSELAAAVAEAERQPAIAAELANLRAQLAALWTIRGATPP